MLHSKSISAAAGATRHRTDDPRGKLAAYAAAHATMAARPAATKRCLSRRGLASPVRQARRSHQKTSAIDSTSSAGPRPGPPRSAASIGSNWPRAAGLSLACSTEALRCAPAKRITSMSTIDTASEAMAHAISQALARQTARRDSGRGPRTAASATRGAATGAQYSHSSAAL